MELLKQLKEANNDRDKLYDDLRKLIQKDPDVARHSPFGAFVTAADATLEFLVDDEHSFKNIVDKYLRLRTVVSCHSPAVWVQAQIDKSNARKQTIGKAADKLIKMAAAQGFKKTNSKQDFSFAPKAVVKIAATYRKMSFFKIIPSLKVTPDIAIKNGKFYIFIKANHLREGGGQQNGHFKKV